MLARGINATIYVGDQWSPLLNMHCHFNAKFDFMLFRQAEGGILRAALFLFQLRILDFFQRTLFKS